MAQRMKEELQMDDFDESLDKHSNQEDNNMDAQSEESLKQP